VNSKFRCCPRRLIYQADKFLSKPTSETEDTSSIMEQCASAQLPSVDISNIKNEPYVHCIRRHLEADGASKGSAATGGTDAAASNPAGGNEADRPQTRLPLPPRGLELRKSRKDRRMRLIISTRTSSSTHPMRARVC